jgi:hypothetical protein
MSAIATAERLTNATAGKNAVPAAPRILDLRKPPKFHRTTKLRSARPLITSSSGPWRIISQLNLPPLVVLQRGRRATETWSDDQLLQIFGLMHNGNPANHIYHGFYDKQGQWQAKWARKVTFSQRAKETVATIRGKKAVGKEVMIGFGPFHTQTKMSYWGAIDFDGKKGACPIQAERSAIAALQFAIRDYPHLHYVLETSGSGGWHLYLFSSARCHATEWTATLTDIVEKVASLLGKPLNGFLSKGVCEIFPAKGNELRRCGNAIRAIGTYNGNSKTFSEVVCESLSGLLQGLPSLQPTKRRSHRTKNKEEPLCLLRDKEGIESRDWEEAQIRDLEQRLRLDLSACHIREGHRHAALQYLIGQTFPKLGRLVVQDLARYLFEKAGGTKECPDLAIHLEEFNRCWRSMEEDFRQGLDETEQSVFDETEDPLWKDAFRIVRNFALAGQRTREHGDLFEVSVGSLAERLGFSTKDSGSRYRKLLMPRIIEQMQPHIVNVRAALFRWVLRDPATFAELGRSNDESSIQPTSSVTSQPDAVTPALDSETWSDRELLRVGNELGRMARAGALRGLDKEEMANITAALHFFGASYEEG